MIRGAVNTNNELVIPLRVRGPVGNVLALEAVIDTGFNGSMTLPPSVVAALGLAYRAGRPTQLGDGTSRVLDTYDAEVEWDGFWIAGTVTETGTVPLVGTRLLAGHEMYVEFRSGGAVDITRLP